MENIDPRVDIAFKKLFGVEENKDLLISLINSIVSEEDKVLDLTLLNPYNPRNFRNDKLSVLDVKAVGVCGKRFNIEIQISDEADYDKRALYYWAKLYTEQLKSGEGYGELSKAIGIHILNFLSIPESPRYHNIFHIREKESGFLYFKDLELHTIELNKFWAGVGKDFAGLVKKIKTSLDLWVAFLTRRDLLSEGKLPKKLTDPGLGKASEVLRIMNFTEEERDAYEGHLKWLRIEASTIKKMEETGREIGRAEGIEEGKILVAKNLLAAGLDLKTISSSTGLSLEEIGKLEKNSFK